MQNDNGSMSLALTLVVSAAFAPTYTLSFESVAVSSEELLQVQVHDLQHDLQDEVGKLREELSASRLEMTQLRQFVKPQQMSASPYQRPPSQQHPFGGGAFCFQPLPPRKSSEEDRAAASESSSTLNAKATEFVFGQPQPLPRPFTAVTPGNFRA
jgi:hypothetical protein